MRILKGLVLAACCLALGSCATPKGMWGSLPMAEPVCKQIILAILDAEEPGKKHDFIPFGMKTDCQRKITDDWQLTEVDPILPVDRIVSFHDAKVTYSFTLMPDGSIQDVKILSSTALGFYDPYVVIAVSHWQVLPVSDGAKKLLAEGGRMQFTGTTDFVLY